MPSTSGVPACPQARVRGELARGAIDLRRIQRDEAQLRGLDLQLALNRHVLPARRGALRVQLHLDRADRRPRPAPPRNRSSSVAFERDEPGAQQDALPLAAREPVHDARIHKIRAQIALHRLLRPAERTRVTVSLPR